MINIQCLIKNIKLNKQFVKFYNNFNKEQKNHSYQFNKNKNNNKVKKVIIKTNNLILNQICKQISRQKIINSYELLNQYLDDNYLFLLTKFGFFISSAYLIKKYYIVRTI